MPTTILVANRGEIAARVVRTARDLGLRSVAVYSDQDIDSPAVALADDAYSLEGTTLQETYLDIAKIIDVAQRAGADAVHPGYGFLSEVPDAAQAVADAGLTWLGPAADTIRQLGDKISARRTALAAGVSPVPGTTDPVQSMEEVDDFVAAHGYPIVLKRSDGGGGRGIEVIRTDEDLKTFAAGHAMAGGDLDKFFMERFIVSGRHIETQCMRDSHGNFAVVTTRDCSVQRRHQKVIEEAPAPFLPEGADETLQTWSKALFDHTDYVGLGTCEFMLTEEGELFFLEVNPRLQVEHTVSEEVTGLDLVEAQFTIADGGSIPEVPEIRGHSIELRLTSEDPAKDLTPTAGKIKELEWPAGHGVRIETGVRLGDKVSPEFDSMIAKLIVTGPDRPRAIARARRALGELSIKGIATSTPVLDLIMAHPDFDATNDHGDLRVRTRWLETTFLPAVDMENLGSDSDGEDDESSIAAALRTFTAQIDGRRHRITLPDGLANLGSMMQSGLGNLGEMGQEIGSRVRRSQPRRGSRRRGGEAAAGAAPVGESLTAEGALKSPMQAIVVRMGTEPGASVGEGDVVIVLEAMKMEKYIHAPAGGTVASIDVAVGQNVNAGDTLLHINAESTEEAAE
ncbi:MULTISPECIES: acetyl/propionyl/methylcrotonyl-CoA carboxylase subunit alpha [unclassified Corynebacterium]|uniref:acetyl/propionyl/methylcrotonyl-CoA carboxylase subunit alpha n=1 Tax=unclassified Corynebacterium TaxID=2624378 RepID=UPI00264789A9|nr:biotin carboxylase N-terminal domain-containing protein [Corynebacterium sp.]MDN5581120.1 ATP-grasp domain-containing protein [Corynebacterium sp.]MDN5719816.1 ATP-grasp domain-containing protein [Corynebacterium sp.]